MFSIFRRKSVSKSRDFSMQNGHFENGSLTSNKKEDFSRNPNVSLGSHHRYSHYSSATSGRDSPPQIVLYSRPPENLTSPNRESSPDPQADLVLQILETRLALHQTSLHQREGIQEADSTLQEQERTNNNHPRVQRKYSKHRIGADGFSTATSGEGESKPIVVRRIRSNSGPLSFLRKSLRSNSSKKHTITSHQNGTSHRNERREKVSRKFSDPGHTPGVAVNTTSTSAKLLPGRASSPKNLITLKPVVPNKVPEHSSPQQEDKMYGMVMKQDNYHQHYHIYNGGGYGVPQYQQQATNYETVSRGATADPQAAPNFTYFEQQPMPDELLMQSLPPQAVAVEAQSRILPQTPANLGVPYYPPPPQSVSASADRNRKFSKDSNPDQKSTGGSSFRAPMLRLSLRSKVQKLFIVFFYKTGKFKEYFF